MPDTTTADRAGQIVRRMSPYVCLNPEEQAAYPEVLAALRAERAAALAEAAAIADAEPEPQGEPPAAWLVAAIHDPVSMCLATVRATKGNIGATIRALAAKEDAGV